MKCLLVAVGVVCSLAYCADADPAGLTLQDAQAQAREHAPERDAADVHVTGAEHVAAAAGRRLSNPVATASYTDGGERSWAVGLEWTVALSGAWRPRHAAARAEVSAAIGERDAALAALDADVGLAFADVADGQRRLARADRLVTLHELAASTAERQLTAGDGTQLDVDAAALDLRAARVGRAQARGDLATARVRLSRLIGRMDVAKLTVVDDVAPGTVPGDVELEARVSADPRVRAAAADVDAARATVETERRAARPDVTFGIELGRIANEIPAGTFMAEPGLGGSWSEWEVHFQVSVPLPLFDRNQTARAEARAQALDVEAHLALVRADVRAEVAEAHAALAAAIEAVEAAADVPEIVEREIGLLDKALRAGALDLPDWSQQARRLEEVGATYDEVVLALQRARAAWSRSAPR